MYCKNFAIKCPCPGISILPGFYFPPDFYKIPVQPIQNRASEYKTVDGQVKLFCF